MSFPLLPWLVCSIALLFLVYNIYVHYTESSYTVDLTDSNSFVAFYPSLTLFEYIESEDSLRIFLEPKKEEWTGWNLPEIPPLPKECILYMDIQISSNLPILSLNLLDKSPIEDSDSYAREYWFRNISNHTGKLYHLEIPINSLERNLYQEDPQAVDATLNLENGFTIQFTLNPTQHKTDVQVDLYLMEFRWKENRIPQMVMGGIFLTLSLWLLYQTNLGFRITQSRYNYSSLRQNTLALLIMIPAFSVINDNPDYWWFMLLGPVLLGFQVIQRMIDHPLLDFHLFFYPFIILLIPINWPVFTLISLGFLFFIPGLFKRLRIQLFSLLFFSFYSLIWISRGGNQWYGLFSIGLVIPLLDFLFRQLKQDISKMDMRTMAQTLYESVLNNIVEVVFITHKDGKLIGYNKGFLKWIGRNSAIPIDTPLEQVLPAQIERQWFLGSSPPERIVVEWEKKRYHYRIRSYVLKEKEEAMIQWFISDITHQQELEIKLNKANHELQAMALTDELTGLPNRRHFNHRLIEEWKRAQRKGSSVTLVVGDIDYFKQYNDTYGHQKGDEAIIHTASIWKDAARRPYDLAARIGGEEFVLLFPNARPEEILHLIHKIQEELQANPIVHKKSPLGKVLTISMGLSSMIPGKDSNWDDLYVLADAWLYYAKNSGKNRIEWGLEYPPEEQHNKKNS